VRKNSKAVLNLQGIQGILKKDYNVFPVIIRQGHVINCFRCLSNNSRTVLQYLFKDIAPVKKNPKVLATFAAL